MSPNGAASASGMDSPEALPMTSSYRQNTESLAGSFASERPCFIFFIITRHFLPLIIFMNGSYPFSHSVVVQ